MKEFFNEIKGNKSVMLLYLFSTIIILVLVISLTYAYFEAQTPSAAIGNVDVQFSTLDEYLITSNGSLKLDVTPTTLPENGNNQEVTATAQVSLKRNPDTTQTVTRDYYVYLKVVSNTFTRTNPLKPEILLNIYLNNQEVTISNLTQVTEGTVTGYDITEFQGLLPIVEEYEIASSSSDTATLHNWSFKLTYLNLDTDQSANIGAIFDAEVMIMKDEYQGFTGTIYRNNTRVAFKNHQIEDELSPGWCREENGVPDCTFPFATQAYCEYMTTTTCSENIVTLGVGDYETNVNTIRTKTYNVYCPIGLDNPTCGRNWYYPTEQDCLEDVDTSVYTCTAGIVNKPYYLKHEVEDDIIESTETCLWYNNHEFCFGSHYWVGDSQDQVDGTTTKAKLQTAMETALGTQADSCDSHSGDAECFFSEFYCNASPDGYVGCGDDVSSFFCEIYGDDLSECGS